MTFAQAFGYFSIILLILIFVRVFWVHLLVIWVILRLTFWVSMGALVSALAWILFFEDYEKGNLSVFWPTWLFFFLTYATMSIVGVLIYIDIYKYFKGFIRNLLKK